MSLCVVRNERGLTLTELTVVIVLAAVLMIGLTGFYMNSQSAWLDSSTQAVTQREATLIVETIRDSTHKSSSILVTPSGMHDRISLVDAGSNVWYEFWWDGTDSLLYHGRPGDPARGPIGRSIVERFKVSQHGESLLTLDSLRLRSATGHRVWTASSFAVLNR